MRNASPGSARQQAGLAATLALAMAVVSLTQFALGTLAPFFTADLGISRAGLGLLSTAFFLAAALGSPLAGRAVDVLGGQRMLQALFVGAGLGFLAMAASPSFPWLVGAVAVAGLALAVGNPVTNQLIAVRVPAAHQGWVVGVKQAGGPMGGVVAGTVLPLVAVASGWRAALAVGAVATGIGLVVATRMGDDRATLAVAAAELPAERAGHGMVGWLVVYAFLMGAGMAVVSAYLPLYAYERVGFSQATAGSLAAVIGVSGIVSRVIWAERAGRLSSIPAVLSLLAWIAALALLLVRLGEGWGSWAVWAGAGVFGAGAVAWNAVGMLAVVRESGLDRAGRASGLVLLAFFLGLVASPAGFGLAVDRLGDYGPAWAGVVVVFVLAALVAAAWHRSRRPSD